jgi:steroid 5-alpha reductase family enzyme
MSRKNRLSRVVDQLRRFKALPDNKGKIMQSGLWQFTRHPNYFGEAVLWWGIWLIAMSALPLSYWWTIISPLTITILVRFVSGVPMLEKKYQDNPEFQEYARRTSAFVPWFPGK